MRETGVGLLLLLLAAGVATAADFQADLTLSEAGMVKNGKILVSGAKYRMEIPDPAGPHMSVLVDPGAGTIRVLVPRYKVYLLGKTDDRRVAHNVPFLVIGMLKKHYDVKSGGTEQCSGYECKKDVIHHGDMDILTVWRSEKLGFPLKMLYHQQEDTFTELTNIKEGPVAAEQFAIPEGWSEISGPELAKKVQADPEMRAKAAAWEASRPKKGEVNKRIEAGGEVRILLGKKLDKLKVTGRPGGRTNEGVWYAIPYRDGKPLVDESAALQKEKATFDVPLDPPPEMLVLGVKEGEVWFRAAYKGYMPLRLAVKETVFRSRPGGRSWDLSAEKTVVTFTADAAEEGKSVYGWMNVSRGKGSDRKTEKTEFRLEPGESKTFTFTADDGTSGLDYNVQTGKVKIEVLEDYRPKGEQTPF